MNVAALPYRQLQAELKTFRDRGYTVPKLNSKRAVLEAALTALIGQQPATPAPVQAFEVAATAVASVDALLCNAWIKLPKKTLIAEAKRLGIKGISGYGKADLAMAIALR